MLQVDLVPHSPISSEEIFPVVENLLFCRCYLELQDTSCSFKVSVCDGWYDLR